MASSPRQYARPSWWLADRRFDDGRWTVAQWPNPAIGVFAVALVLRWLGLAVVGVTEATEVLELAGRGALIVWGLDELARGVNPFRRVLGAGVLAWQLAALVEAGWP